MANIKEAKTEKHFRPLEDLNLIDNFLFHTIVTQGEDGEEFCRILLSTILGKQIRRVRVVAQQSIPGMDTDRHGIRMDAYVEDISDEEELTGCERADAEVIPDIYDIEPNNAYERDTLPKRMRYYHGLIDSKKLDAGTDYDKLPKVVIIIILPYDPFGKKRMVYTIKNQCTEDVTIPYEDGARKIVTIHTHANLCNFLCLMRVNCNGRHPYLKSPAARWVSLWLNLRVLSTPRSGVRGVGVNSNKRFFYIQKAPKEILANHFAIC